MSGSIVEVKAKNFMKALPGLKTAIEKPMTTPPTKLRRKPKTKKANSSGSSIKSNFIYGSKGNGIFKGENFKTTERAANTEIKVNFFTSEPFNSLLFLAIIKPQFTIYGKIIIHKGIYYLNFTHEKFKIKVIISLKNTETIGAV